MKNLEQKLHYHFKDPSLLELALTHSSFANEKGAHRDNERLEFLGDSVLGFITAEYLYNALPGTPEGELTKLRSAAVCEKSLAVFARQLGLGSYLRLGKGEVMSGGADRPSILSDAFESVIAAIYLDGGIRPARTFVLRFIKTAQTDVAAVTDYKTRLQEIVQQNPDEHLSYVLAAEAGPDHDKTFTVEVYLNSNCIATGEGHSKKKAEQDAARKALELMGVRL
jgi:ribonuclease-3